VPTHHRFAAQSDSPYGDDPALRHRVSSYLEKVRNCVCRRSVALTPVQYTLDVDPQQWGTAIGWDAAEDDDALHAPERDARALDRNGGLTSVRGAANLGCIVLIVLVLLALLCVRARTAADSRADAPVRSLAYPVTTFYTTHPLGTLGAFGLGGTNASGQVPVIANGRALIDPDTPPSAYTRPSWTGADDMVLVFSDEFTADGRTFYPGDDPFWEAVDLHYWVCGDASQRERNVPPTADCHGSRRATWSGMTPQQSRQVAAASQSPSRPTPSTGSITPAVWDSRIVLPQSDFPS
jgi:hypothetical protein